MSNRNPKNPPEQLAPGRITYLVGAQYGSEGKGKVSQLLHEMRSYAAAVRIGGANAGHTIIHEGRAWAMQIIPCGWVDPLCRLVIGAGAVVDLPVLYREIRELEQAYGEGFITNRLFVDEKAFVVTDENRTREGGVDGDLHKSIGSTGKGVGLARIDRIRRSTEDNRTMAGWRDDSKLSPSLRGCVVDTLPLLLSMYDHGGHIMVEGTQGSGLSLIHGPWPFVTSEDTNAAGMASAVGFSPRLNSEVVLVARTLPIRVAGNSGPLRDEQTWEQVSELAGRSVTERTTVTKKTRRIGLWDPELFERAVDLNRPDWVALMFADYLPAPQLNAVVDDIGSLGLPVYVTSHGPLIEDTSVTLPGESLPATGE